SLFMLIYFIHYICHVIQIDNMLESLTHDLLLCLNRIDETKDNHKTDINIYISNQNSTPTTSLKLRHTQIIESDNSGYIQAINYNEILNYAEKNDLIINIEVGPG